MAVDAHANFAVSAVATAPSPASSGTSLVVTAGQGSRFPAVPFNAVVCPASTQPDPSNAEIVRVTNISTDTLTITRAQESSSARSITVGDQIFAAVTKKTLTDIETTMTLAAVVPNTAPSAGQILAGNAGGTAYAPVSMSGDATLSSAGALTVTGLAGDVTGSDHKITRVMMIDWGATAVDKGNSSTTAQTMDYTAGSLQKITATGNFTVNAPSNWPPSGNYGAILLQAINFGAYTVSWPTINWVKPDGTTTTSVTTWLAAWTGRTAFQSSGTDWVILWTTDAGSTVYGGWAH